MAKINPEKLADDLRDFARRFRGLSGAKFSFWVDSDADLPKLGKRSVHVSRTGELTSAWRTFVEVEAILHGVTIEIKAHSRPSTPEEIRREQRACGEAPSPRPSPRPSRPSTPALVRVEDDLLPFEEEEEDTDDTNEEEAPRLGHRAPWTAGAAPALSPRPSALPLLQRRIPESASALPAPSALALPPRQDPGVIDVEYREVALVVAPRPGASDECVDVNIARREATARYRAAVAKGDDPVEARTLLDAQLRMLQPGGLRPAGSPPAPAPRPSADRSPGQEVLPLYQASRAERR